MSTVHSTLFGGRGLAERRVLRMMACLLAALSSLPAAGCQPQTLSSGQVAGFSSADVAAAADAGSDGASDGAGDAVESGDAGADACPGIIDHSELLGTPVCLCALPTLLEDSFDNSNLSTGGANGGFSYIAYGFGDAKLGSAAEYDGAMRLSTPVQSAGAEPPEVQALSLSSLDAHLEGLTVVLQVAETTVPSRGGITLSVQSSTGSYQTLGNTGLELHVFSAKAAVSGLAFGGHDHRVVLLGRTYIPGGGSGFEILGYSDYNPDALTNGFAVVLAVGPAGWSYRILGLSSSPIQSQGLWKGGVGYDKSLDGTNFVGVSIQGEANDAVARKLTVHRLQVLRGICAP